MYRSTPRSGEVLHNNIGKGKTEGSSRVHNSSRGKASVKIDRTKSRREEPIGVLNIKERKR